MEKNFIQYSTIKQRLWCESSPLDSGLISMHCFCWWVLGALLHLLQRSLLSYSTLSHLLGFPGWLSFLLGSFCVFFSSMASRSLRGRLWYLLAEQFNFILVGPVQDSSIAMRLLFWEIQAKHLTVDLGNKTRNLFTLYLTHFLMEKTDDLLLYGFMKY